MRRNSKIAIILLGGLVLMLFSGSTAAETTEDKIRELEQKAETYRKLIELKQQQQGTLTNQLALMAVEEQKLEAELEIKKSELGDVSSQVERINKQINQHESEMGNQRIILGDLIRIYYESKRSNIDLRLIGEEDLFSALKREDDINETGVRLNDAVARLEEIKTGLERDRRDLEQKENEIISLAEKLKDKNEALDNSKQQKKQLLAETRGQEAKYQELLRKVEQQKEQLLNIDELASTGGLSADAYDKPTEGLASASWFYSQKDPRWGNEEIGRSRSKMKDWGCAVTAVAMVFKYHGASLTPLTLANSSKYFSWDLIKWPTTWSDIELVSTISHGNINWTTIDKELRAGNPVIIYIKKTNGGGGHYVVIHHKTSKGKYVVHDPYFGANLYLDTSRSLVGKMGVDSGTVMDQMIIYHK